MQKRKDFHPIKNRMEFHQMQTLHVDETPYAFAFLFSKQSASKSFFGTESLFFCKCDLMDKGMNTFINVYSKRFKFFLC